MDDTDMMRFSCTLSSVWYVTQKHAVKIVIIINTTPTYDNQTKVSLSVVGYHSPTTPVRPVPSYCKDRSYKDINTECVLSLILYLHTHGFSVH